VVDATCEPPRVLRWGAIDVEALSPVLGAWSEA
jgi:tRNA A37 threonylcarbamoyladenosine synthetase subunit TsaC/SUA5/YrdC